MIWVLIFELIVILIAILLIIYLSKSGYKNILRKFIIMFIGILIFEVMSAPMWHNQLLDKWAYIYRDVSWIISLGWMEIFTVSILLVDHAFRHLPERKRFWLYLFAVQAITLPIEIWLVQSGIRSYDQILTSSMTGYKIPFTMVPLEAVYAIPIIGALVIAFYKYISHLFDHRKTYIVADK